MPDKPPIVLVLLPGMDGTGLMFEPFLAVLRGFEPLVVRYPPELTSYPDCVAFARQQLPVDRPFLLLGESFSGPVALALAAERPAGLQGLVLCVTFARNPRPRLAWLAPLLRLLPPRRLPLPLLGRLLLGGHATATLAALVGRMLPLVPTATLKQRLLAVVAVDHTALLDRVQVPILALRAGQDRLVPKAATDWVNAHRPIDIVTLEGPHWLLQTRPEACLQALQAFVQRNGNPSE
ncbi:MAG: alpha/beta hydrolase [Holophagaceae bacterium]|uniref:Alpha/beta hydrolase n=1 Tax=Candidatus Geothrix skivensis TaxID=2954439 RepID=A0A9D7SKA3_9BACT|nr:alpha/beta hydrolase [Candidatus Geothrix skivensis]